MRKFFTLAVAVLASLTMMAADKAPSSSIDISAVTSENWGTWTNGTPVLNANGFHITGYMGKSSASSQTWVGYQGGNTSSSDAWIAPEGSRALGAAAYGEETTYMTMRTDRQMYFRVTGCTEAYALVATQNSGDRRVTLSAYEYTTSRAAEASVSTTSADSGNDIEEISITGLDASKVYEIVLAGTASGNANFYEICFASGSVTPSTDPVGEVTIAGPTEGYVGYSVSLKATFDVKPDTIYWTVDGAVQDNHTATLALELTAERTYQVACWARNQYNAAEEWKSANHNVVATVKPAAESCATIIPASAGTNPTAVGTEIDLDIMSEGGKIFVAGMKKTDGTSIVYNALGLGLMTGGADSIRVEFNNYIKEGSVIKLVIAAGGTGERGLKLQTPAKSTLLDAKWTPEVAGEVKEFEYEVPAGSKLIGDYRILLARNNSVYLQSVSMADCGDARDIPVDTDPVLNVSADSINLAVTAAVPVDSAIVIFSGKNLPAGEYALSIPDLAGLTIDPVAVTVGENGKLQAAIKVKYAMDIDVAAASTSFSLTIGELTKTVKVGYSAVQSKEYMSSINIEQLVLDYGKGYNISAALEAAHIDFASIDALDSLNDSKSQRNEPYLGLKLKTGGAYIAGWIHAGDTISVKFGAVGCDIKARINGQEQTFAKEDLANGVLGRRAATEEYLELITTSEKTVVLKQIMVNENIKDVVLPGGAKHEVSVATLEHGTITFNGTLTTDSIEVGAVVTITETPAEGYHFVEWNVYKKNAESTKVTVANAKFNMPDYDVVIAAVYAEDEPTLYLVTIAATEHGTIIFTDVDNEDHMYAKGNEVHLNITADEGYKLVSASAGNEALLPDEDGNCSFVMPGQAVTVSATFEENSGQGFDNIDATVKATKRLINGKLFIEKNGKLYDAQGAMVK